MLSFTAELGNECRLGRQRQGDPGWMGVQESLGTSQSRSWRISTVLWVLLGDWQARQVKLTIEEHETGRDVCIEIQF